MFRFIRYYRKKKYPRDLSGRSHTRQKKCFCFKKFLVDFMFIINHFGEQDGAVGKPHKSNHSFGARPTYFAQPWSEYSGILEKLLDNLSFSSYGK